MCTYNGERFIEDQLDSIEKQTHQNWQIIASDDSSEDQTLFILKKYQIKWGEKRLIIKNGPKKGFCQNFLSLCCDPNIRADYYCFCDQDDVWMRDKLKIGINLLSGSQENIAKFYCGRTEYVDENLNRIGFSPLFTRKPSFQNALVQSIAGGNTIIFNQSTKFLLERVGARDVVSHDWWLYQIVTGCGGQIIYDENPQILYRQHDKALIGGNISLVSRIKRLNMAYKNKFKKWNEKNTKALQAISSELTPTNRKILSRFIELRDAKLYRRIQLLMECKLYRQTWRGTVSLVIGTFLNKL